MKKTRYTKSRLRWNMETAILSSNAQACSLVLMLEVMWTGEVVGDQAQMGKARQHKLWCVRGADCFLSPNIIDAAGRPRILSHYLLEICNVP
tara:strand:- start:9929 stop:10204 length:276 start_codon:yes stop_codon:yes gene_type:complete